MHGTITLLAILVVGSGAGGCMPSADLQEIDHRGVLRFRIPATWSAEAGGGGGGVYSSEAGDSGTLRLDLLTFEKTGVEVTANSALELVSRLGEPNSRVSRLENGNALREYQQSSEEGGESLTIWFWELASAVPPHHHRLALFSYTVLASEAKLPATTMVVDLLRREIAAAQFAPELGVFPE